MTNVKAVIDRMRTTRDTSNTEMTNLKNKIKEQNAKLVQLSQEKAKLDAKNKANPADQEQMFNNKQVSGEIPLKILQNKLILHFLRMQNQQ